MSCPTCAPGVRLDALLMEAFLQYRDGLRRQPQPVFPVPLRSFNALVFLGTVGRMPPADRLRLRHLQLACRQGLDASRQGRLDEAQHYYEVAEEHLESLQRGVRLARLLGVCSYQSGAAYLDFRRGFAAGARERLERSMDADLELEQSDLPVMQLHRIQVGHNLARMDLRLGRRETAVGLAGMLLAYLERRIDRLPYHHDWRSRSLQAMPRVLLRAMIHQIASETAGLIVTGGGAPAEEWRCLIAAAELCRDPETAVFPQVQHALRSQSELLAGNAESYLRNLRRFFGPGIRHCPLLWYIVLVELVRFCGEADTCRSRQVRDAIVRDAVKWKGFPPFLRDRLDGLAAERSVA